MLERAAIGFVLAMVAVQYGVACGDALRCWPRRASKLLFSGWKCLAARFGKLFAGQNFTDPALIDAEVCGNMMLKMPLHSPHPNFNSVTQRQLITGLCGVGHGGQTSLWTP